MHIGFIVIIVVLQANFCNNIILTLYLSLVLHEDSQILELIMILSDKLYAWCTI